MTIREHLTGKHRCTSFIAVSAWLAIAIGRAANHLWIMPPGFLCIMGAILYLSFAMHCPVCRGSMGAVVDATGWGSFGKRICFCPYCAVNLDADAQDSP